ncbi:MAG: UvrD-helicase domain-containing protein [Alphaproteobacteria bacterium]|nr:UvrD-helicase domain-containing protein [Alphaproteobacteria bacterium]
MTLPLPQPSFADPNANQRTASDPASSVWVNASAGSGKTTVLTARVTRLLLSGVRPEKILCLTYTRAGAAEMANRVTATLSKWAVCDDKELDHDLDKLQASPPTAQQRTEARRLFARVLSCPGGLRIRTIHSFCQEILSRFPLEAGLPPHFALIDEQDLKLLGNEVLDDLLREAEEHPDQELAQALTVLIAAQGESGFADMLQEVMHARARLAEAQEKTIAKMRGLLQLEQGETPERLRFAAIQNAPEDILRQLAAWLLKGSSRYQTRGAALADFLKTPMPERAARFDDYLSLFLTKEREPFSKSFVASNDIRKQHPDVDDICSREASRLQSVLERIEAAEIADITASVLIVGSAFAARIEARKAARAAVDYDDLILFTQNLLRRQGIAPWILYKLDRGIDHILVDEAQDTSRAQWNIVQALTQEFFAQENRGRTLFVVGDEKQSIFSFQNADPEAFLSLREDFSRRLTEAGGKLEKIGLHTSFRSAPAILTAVDTIFALDAARAGVSQELVTHNAAPNKDGSEKIGRVELWPLLEPDADKAQSGSEWEMPTGYEDERDPQAELAQQIAGKIKFWLTRHETLPGASRPIAPGDIMILLRRRGRFADLMVRALKACAVPVTGVDRMRLIRQLPVMDLLAMLRFVLLPEDDLNLAALLRSPLIGLSEEQLMELAIGRTGSLWQSIKDKAPKEKLPLPLREGVGGGGERPGSAFIILNACSCGTPPPPTPSLKGRGSLLQNDDPTFAATHAYLAAKLNEADFSPPFAFLSHILNAPCPANADSGRKALWMRLGDECLDPIEELLNAAQNFSSNHSPSLQNFLRWLTQSDAEIKRELDQGDQQEGGQVRIMTVHASKGLEAPIVFLPDTTAVPRATDLPKFQWKKDTPLFLTRAPKFGEAKRLWQEARDKQLEEYRRLFYVALTRASNRLYLCGWQNGKSEMESSWYGLAAAALRPLHQDFLPADASGPAPEIAFANSAAFLAQPPQTPPPIKPKTPLPAWALQSVEKPQTVVSFAPSHDVATATPDAAFARGRIIHRLLQSLPDIAPERRGDAVARFLAPPRYDLTQAQREEIAGEVSRLLNDEKFAALFAPDSLAEAPLTGRLDGTNVFRQVDRLCLCGDEVWIVDYKTNRPPPDRVEDIPAAYRQQLAEYRLLLRGIFPDKKVRCFLLWTYAPRLMEVTF